MIKHGFPPVVLLLISGCCLFGGGGGIEIPEATKTSLLNMEEKKSDVQQMAHSFKSRTTLDAATKQKGEELYVAAKSKHDAFMTGLILDIQVDNKKNSEALDKKAKEASETMDVFVTFVQKHNVTPRAAWVPIVAALVDLGIKIWKAYDEAETAKKNAMRESLIKRIESLRLANWDAAK